MQTSEIVILTGAGVSAESGLSTFRDKGGVWSQVRLEDVATPQAFMRDPVRVHDFYNSRRGRLPTVMPNPAHEAIARLQRGFAGRVTLITQNVDDLHERGGSPDVIHMHGQLNHALCAGCGHQWGWQGSMSTGDVCAACGAQGTVRPDVVWFGEMPYHMDLIAERMAGCDLFVAIGTSGAVYPAAGFVAGAREQGARTIEINLEPSENTALFDEQRLGRASETVPQWVDSVLK
ncbi:MAG: NAD-dependent deacylase [Paracoccaceae bacterium]|nr:NAD-dependent deacylase [Paracoccaceae bacterium]